MTATAFYVADAAKRPRIAEPMPDDRFVTPVAGIRDPMVPRRWESGGAGMVGTIGDYARFAQMLLNGGTFEGPRYLKPETISLMTSDHIGPETKIARDYFYFPGASAGFGLGFSVRTSPYPRTSWPLGEYRWDGIEGTFLLMAHENRVRDEFTRQAATFSASPAITDGALTLRFIDALGEAARGSVLDVACGPGILSAAIAKTARQVVAFDLTPHMLTKAAQRCAEAGLDNVTFREGNAAELPFADADFDAVVTPLSLHHFDPPPPAISDIFRLLPPA